MPATSGALILANDTGAQVHGFKHSAGPGDAVAGLPCGGVGAALHGFGLARLLQDDEMASA